MVIVIMGDVDSSRNRVGRLLAEYLGWEFADVESLHCAALSSGSLNDTDRTPRMKALFSAIDSLNYEWRDVIVSSSILDEDDQSLNDHHPLVRFVQLKATDTARGLATRSRWSLRKVPLPRSATNSSSFAGL